MVPPKVFSPPAEPVPELGGRYEESAFGWPFWLTYCSNTSLMIGVSLLFRYADFVKLLGGSEFQLGMIVGVGMVGSLFMRLAQGVGIDAWGPRRIWLISAALFQIACLGHLLVHDISSPAIYVLRVLFQTSLAGFFGASITYISGRAPISRMAEVIGSLGTSGFVGIATGTFLSDRILHDSEVTRAHVTQLFGAAAAMGLSAFIFGALATRSRHAGTPIVRNGARTMIRRMPLIIRRSHPGVLLLVSVAMGFGLGLPPIFVRPYMAEVGIQDIALFFFLYTLTAFITRVSIRRMPAMWGIRPMILLGLGSMAIGMLSFLLVAQRWQVVFPAVLIGVAHACLFPAVVAGGSGTFPPRYRGVGTTLVLAMFDLGGLIGSPTVGSILTLAQYAEWPRYPTMFAFVAIGLALVGGVYFYASRLDPAHSAPSQRPEDVKRRVRRRRRKIEA